MCSISLVGAWEGVGGGGGGGLASKTLISASVDRSSSV